ncbi:hypothetical protein [Rufibacter sp. LB8]|uniref:hypothetical protein n=1 Tax=Rufibacter sp. LB8 TaxID=2777781 RepID=UPI00178C4FC2|nr:hypothetical protein [Rufibacter sp. LB8]
MLLYKDSLVELQYEVATDVLSMEWPDVTGFSKSEISHYLQKVIDTLKHYDVRRYLIDSRHNKVEVTETEQKNIAYQFSTELLKTRVNKMARVVGQNTEKERRVENMRQQLVAELPFEMEYQEFTDMATALSWLKA